MKRIILSLAILLSTFAGFAQPACGPDSDGQFFPDPQMCERFYSCENGMATLHECPPGLYFNATLQVCDWPETSGCAHIHAACKSGTNGNCVHRACTVSGCDLLINVCEATSGFAICQTQ